jgi:hypothetical protein
MQQKEDPMRKALVALGALVVSFAIGVPAAHAGSPHFIHNAFSVSVSDTTLTVSGKEAGLGDESQVDIQVTATAECINNGGHHPKAVNKAGVAASGTFPVQNGKADFTLTATATFQPDCSPPMTVVFTDITVTDVTNGISASL